MPVLTNVIIISLTFLQPRAEAVALLPRVEADVRFLEEMEKQSFVKGLPESPLLATLRDLRQLVWPFEVNKREFRTELHRIEEPHLIRAYFGLDTIRETCSLNCIGTHFLSN